jgi:excisionase family DNA binding protein
MTTTNDKHTEQPTSQPLLLTVEQAACLLQFGRSTVYEMIASGELPSVKRGASRRVPREALERWVTEQTRAGS